MKKKILLIIFLVSIIASLIAVWGRYKAEYSSNGVELIMDYSSLNLLKVDELGYLKKLKENGLTAVAIYPDNIKVMLKGSNAKLITGNELNRLAVTAGEVNPVLASYPYDEDSSFLIINGAGYVKRLQEYLLLWKKEYDIEYHIEGDNAVVFFPEWKNKFANLSLGFDKGLIENIKKSNLKVIPRFYNNKLGNDYNWKIMNEFTPYAVIFAGSEITGYKENNKSDLKRTADIMLQNNIKFGMIESFIAKQKGANSLAYYLDFNILRVHSIQQKEMDEREDYNKDKIVDRYLRAVRERNVRLLYLKPFLQERDNIPPEERTLSFINSISKNLLKEGYSPGSSKTFMKYGSPVLLLLLTGLGIITAGIVLLEYIWGVSFNRYFWILILAGAIVQLGLLIIGKEFFLRKLLALGSAVTFPSLAIITQLLFSRGENWLIRFLKASGISLIGAVFLSAALAHISFILKVDQFVGVKVSFVLPIIFISIFYIKKYFELNDSNLVQKIFLILDSNIKVKHVLLLFVFALGGMIYIGRTGNNSIIPVPDVEVLFRDYLENLLYIRPRFKEFLIGHPFLILSLGLGNQLGNKLFYFPFLILASIGQINILNTFSHIHTPFIVSMIRSVNGMCLGLIIGVLLLFLLRYILSVWNRKRDKYYA